MANNASWDGAATGAALGGADLGSELSGSILPEEDGAATAPSQGLDSKLNILSGVELPAALGGGGGGEATREKGNAESPHPASRSISPGGTSEGIVSTYPSTSPLTSNLATSLSVRSEETCGSVQLIDGLYTGLVDGSHPKYAKKKLLGSGSYGKAYLVTRSSDNKGTTTSNDTTGGTKYVAKVLDMHELPTRAVNLAETEIQCLASCSHFGVVKHIENSREVDPVTQKKKVIVIVMEHADAGDLAAQLAARKISLVGAPQGFTNSTGSDGAAPQVSSLNQKEYRYLQSAEVGQIFVQICLALDHIHSRRMLHRDLKSANIFLTTSGLVKIGDFGLSQAYDSTVSGHVAASFVGTPNSIAPEMWHNINNSPTNNSSAQTSVRYSKKADMWALGVILYELLSLGTPFGGSGTMADLQMKILTGNYNPLPPHLVESGFIDPAMKEIMESLLTIDPFQRPSTEQLFAQPKMAELLQGFKQSVSSHGLRQDSDGSLRAQILKDIAALEERLCLGNAISDFPIMNSAGGAEAVLMEGTLAKESSTGDGKWKQRTLILTRQALRITVGSQEAAPIPLVKIVSAIPAFTAAEKLPDVAARRFVFVVNTETERMKFRVKSEQERSKWLECIQVAAGF